MTINEMMQRTITDIMLRNYEAMVKLNVMGLTVGCVIIVDIDNEIAQVSIDGCHLDASDSLIVEVCSKGEALEVKATDIRSVVQGILV